VFSLGLNEVQQALDGKANEIQREFVSVSGRLEEIGRLMLEVRGQEKQKLLVEHKELRKRQQELADEVNLWRDRAKSVRQQRSMESLKTFLSELLPEVEPHTRSILERTIYLIDAPDEERAQIMQDQASTLASTPAGRFTRQ
jgi:molecular chaperone GrpE (heat shock protein)